MFPAVQSHSMYQQHCFSSQVCVSQELGHFQWATMTNPVSVSVSELSESGPGHEGSGRLVTKVLLRLVDRRT